MNSGVSIIPRTLGWILCSLFGPTIPDKAHAKMAKRVWKVTTIQWDKPAFCVDLSMSLMFETARHQANVLWNF
jgi:hypothetical protein